MKNKLLLAFICLNISFNLLTLPAFSQEISKCEQHQEIFKFQVPNYTIQHQGGAVLDLKIAYRFTAEAINQNDYPDLIPIKKDIDKFMLNYPNETDFWEIMNKKLVQFLLDKYPQIASLRVEIGVMPIVNEPYNRASIVYSTRAENCSLIGDE